MTSDDTFKPRRSYDPRSLWAGAPTHPAWFHNLRATPLVTVELGDKSYQATAVVTSGEERDRLYRMVSDGTSAYEQNTDRTFPVIVLEGVLAPA